MKNALNALLFFSTLSFSGWTLAESEKKSCSVTCDDGSFCSITGYNVKCYCKLTQNPGFTSVAVCTSGKSSADLSNPDNTEGADGASEEE